MAAEPSRDSVLQVIRNFSRLYPDQVAAALDRRDPEETQPVLADLPPISAAAILDRLSPAAATETLAGMEADTATGTLQALEPARAAALLARLDQDRRQRLLSGMKPNEAKQLQELASYPSGSAGSLMDPRVTAFREDATAGEAIARLRQRAPRGELYDVFLVDGEGVLRGAAALSALALAPLETRLSSLSRGVPALVQATASREEVADVLERLNLASLPVVDFQGRLVGVILHDVLVETAQEEASVDIQSMVGAGREERALSPAWLAVRKRLPWLQVNLATAFLAAAVVGAFEDTIAKFTALAVLLPVVAGQSGNTGAQALAVTMRGLALREISLHHWPRVLLKEVSAGFMNGCAVAAVTSLGVYFWSGSAGLCLVIGVAMVLSMGIAGVAGACVPMVLSAVGQDPAQSSSIVLTTVTDVMGFLSFLGLATVFAGIL